MTTKNFPKILLVCVKTIYSSLLFLKLYFNCTNMHGRDKHPFDKWIMDSVHTKENTVFCHNDSFFLFVI